MLHSTSSFHNDVVSFTASRRHGRRSRPMALLALLGAVLASGLVLGHLAPSRGHTTYDSQPFAHIPR